MLNHNYITDDGVEHMLKTHAGYEPGHENSPFSINDAMNAATNLINVSTSVQNPKYYKKPTKQ